VFDAVTVACVYRGEQEKGGLMRYRIATLLLLACVGGCHNPADRQNFSVFFQPYSADLDPQAQDTVHAASAFAKDHPSQPVVLIGYSAPPDPGKDIPGLSAQRVAAVQAMMVGDGVPMARTYPLADGTTDPKNMPKLSVRRVDIDIGSPPPY